MSDSELYRRLGRAVADRRRALGFTQRIVAEKIGLSRASLANLETGRQRIMVHHLYALTNVLQLTSILDLVPGSWNPPGPTLDIEVRGTDLSPQQRSSIELLLATALAGNSQERRSR